MHRIPKTLKALGVFLTGQSHTEAQQAAASAALASASSKGTAIFGGGSIVVSMFTSPQFWSVLVGAIGVFGGMAITWFFKRNELAIKREFAERRDRREQEEHDSRMLARYAGMDTAGPYIDGGGNG
ncbi:MAG: hypothetical protein Q4A97_08470 [Comamonadaceae bacterium]|nr:hypothetical protein [Comamonadaceae bacterium]